MSVKIIGECCPEQVEDKIRGTYNEFESRKCGKPIYLDGVCANCWRMNEQLRGEFSPMGATGGVSERLDASGYERLYVERETLTKKVVDKGIDRDVEAAMKGFDSWATELLKSGNEGE